MDSLYDTIPEPELALDRLPERCLDGITEAEHVQGNADLLWAMKQTPDQLARTLAAAVFRLRPAALQAVARLVIRETTPNASGGTGPAA